ncbi:hypothetical protein [Paenibacillus andongensis]|uniref:hypothetical protein n=1 Tax=Paenibacillus andongensis TaxID=2975482 RepID=UPI0021BBA4AD|nr:hypothetical protein [Paenibacillus andongensis]
MRIMLKTEVFIKARIIMGYSPKRVGEAFGLKPCLYQLTGTIGKISRTQKLDPMNCLWIKLFSF